MERDEAGEPTGILRGPDAWDRVAAAMPHADRAEGARRWPAPRPAWPRTASRASRTPTSGSTAGVAAELAAWGEALASGAMPLAVALLPGLARIAP